MSRLVDAALGIVLAACGVLAIRSVMPWIWWDLVVGAVLFTAEDAPISFALAVGLVVIGIVIAVGHAAIWLHERGTPETCGIDGCDEEAEPIWVQGQLRLLCGEHTVDVVEIIVERRNGGGSE
ncbi:hypothetical protein [Salinarchaeum laminariae]|uniref:hypothetical protein n=1 Tax=Salinarchaeum laminariae TaxID=869888 RepID=UPI0020BED898|nr:hypothetical protein [Salinarchaeum laminariae]